MKNLVTTSSIEETAGIKEPSNNGSTPVDSAYLAETSNEHVHKEILVLTKQKANTNRGSADRKRGRKPDVVPSPKHFQVLLATATQTYDAVAATHSITKQRVGQIVRRWREYLPVRPPLEPKQADNVDVRAKKKQKKEYIISFRITSPEIELLRCRYPEAKSASRAARRILMSFLSL